MRIDAFMQGTSLECQAIITVNKKSIYTNRQIHKIEKSKY